MASVVSYHARLMGQFKGHLCRDVDPESKMLVPVQAIRVNSEIPVAFTYRIYSLLYVYVNMEVENVWKPFVAVVQTIALICKFMLKIVSHMFS